MISELSETNNTPLIVGLSIKGISLIGIGSFFLKKEKPD